MSLQDEVWGVNSQTAPASSMGDMASPPRPEKR